MVYNKKRWQLAVEAGKNVPFIGGSKMTLGSRGLDKKIKAVVAQQTKKTEEIKLLTFGFGGGNLLHDTLYSVAPLQGLTEGIQSNQRIGTQIFLRNMRLSGQITNLTTQGQVSYRFLLIRSTIAYNVSAGWGSGVGSTDFMYNNGVPKIIELINHKAENTKVLMDKRITVNPSNANGFTNTVPYAFDYKPMHKITYTGENLSIQSTTPYNYYWVIIPNYYLGTVGTTVVGNVTSTSLVSFTD